jgi:methylmalonyl-CoA/ethylmalonyl-CoA epimerase
MKQGLSKIGQIAVNAHDIGRAEVFYRDVLGMKHLFTVPPTMSFFDCDGIVLMLGLPSSPQFDHASSCIYFNVPDIHATTETLKSQGVRFEEDPAFVANLGTYDLWLAFFRDSEDNILALRSEVPHSNKPETKPDET